MLDQDFQNRINCAQDAITWIDLDFNKNNGTVQCPFCLSKNKGYLWDNYFRCFSSRCNKKGNKISFIQEYKNLSFIEALSYLENIGNIDIEAQEDFYIQRSNLLSEVLDAYHDQLLMNEAALNYLQSRGFKYEYIKLQKIGYAPNNSILASYPINYNSLRRHLLLGKHGEFFDQRIVFPIYNTKGYLVHLTGRSFPKENKDYKYLDTSSIPIIGSSKDYMLFEKHHSMYKENEPLFLVEGVPDSYILNQCGINVYGLMGLNKLLKQIPKLQKHKEVIAVFDNDRFELDHPYYANEFKSWRLMLDQLVDLQICLGSSTVIKVCMIPENLINGNSKVKDVNDLFLYLNKNKNLLVNTIHKNSIDIVAYYIEAHKDNLQYHKTCLKLINSTKRGKDLLEKYIPKDNSALDYALNILGA